MAQVADLIDSFVLALKTQFRALSHLVFGGQTRQEELGRARVLVQVLCSIGEGLCQLGISGACHVDRVACTKCAERDSTHAPLRRRLGNLVDSHRHRVAVVLDEHSSSIAQG